MRWWWVLPLAASACRPHVDVTTTEVITHWARLPESGQGGQFLPADVALAVPSDELPNSWVLGWTAEALAGINLPDPERLRRSSAREADGPCAPILPPPTLVRRIDGSGVPFRLPTAMAPRVEVDWLPSPCTGDAGLELDGATGDGGGLDSGPDGGVGDVERPDGLIFEQVAVQGRPFGLATTSGGRVAVPVIQPDEVAILWGPALAVERRISTLAQPTNAAYNADGTRLAVACQLARAIAVYDPGGVPQREIRVSDHPWRVAFGAEGLLYATSEGPWLRRIDPLSGVITATLAIAAEGNGILYDAREGGLLLSARTGLVTEVNLSTFTIRRSIPIAGKLQDLALGPDRRLWIADEDGPIHCYDLSQHTDCGRIDLIGEGAFGLAMSPDGQELWASFSNSGEVALFDPQTRVARARWFVGGMPRRVAFSSDGTEVLIANEEGWVERVRR